MAKHYLNNPEADLDFVLYGITSPDSQYRVASLINDGLGIDLCLSEYVQMAVKPGKMFGFSLFQFADEELGLEYLFVPNLSNSSSDASERAAPDLFSDVAVEERVRLVKELPKTDYFLIVRGERARGFAIRIGESLRSIEGIGRAQAIAPEQLSSSRNLLF